ncbi:MAG: PQQ-binding-like beta-propeller repeat protein, partial [Chitinispirillaceae bacterium]|nr:PQQ-binding-like beta-propeller repeat protein [Chitinispirillaceae bacterium]
TGAIDGGSSDLEFNYEGTGSSNSQVVGLRFSHEFLRLPAGSTIDSAFIQFGVDETKGGTLPCTLLIQGEASGNSAPLSTTAYMLSSRTTTGAQVTWDVPAWTAVGQNGPDQRTPDVSAIVQELVNRSDWTGSSAITFMVKGIGGDGIRCVDAADENQLTAKLIVYSSSIEKDSVSTRPQDVVIVNPDSNVVYFGSGLYPFEGTIIHALNAQTGEVVWMNDAASMFYTKQPHNTADGFSGLSPQGYFCLAGTDNLIVPNGRSAAACIDRITGKLVHYNLGGVSKTYGGYHTVGGDDVFYICQRAFKLSDGTNASSGTAPALYNENDVMIKAGTVTYSAGQLFEAYMAGATTTTVTGSDGFSADVDGRAISLVAANGHFLVSTDAGKIYCYAPKACATPKTYTNMKPRVKYTRAAQYAARDIIEAAGYRDGSKGICIVAGLTDGSVAEQLALQSDLTVIAFEDNADKVNHLRKKFNDRDLYGRNLHIVNMAFSQVKLPAYIASIVTSEMNTVPASWNREMVVAEAFRALRPYGGTAILGVDRQIVDDVVGVPGNVVISGSRPCSIKRTGALPGTAPWSHVAANEHQTGFINDTTIKLPLGITWFGGSEDNTNDKILPRHGHGLLPLVSGGRIYQQGRDLVRAVDLYTGRVLWEKEITNIGQYSDLTAHQAGHVALGGNLVALEDRIYVLGPQNRCGFSTNCLVLDAVTGETVSDFSLPGGMSWGMITVTENEIITTSDMLQFDPFVLDCYTTSYNNGLEYYGPGDIKSRNGAYGLKLFVLDRKTGSVKWQADAANGFYSYAMTTGNGKLYVVDNSIKQGIDVMSRYGVPVPPKAHGTLTAYDLATGAVIWRKDAVEDNIFGSWLGYNAAHDMLVEAMRKHSDYYSDEKTDKMAVYNASTGDVVWKQLARSYAGGPVMLDDTLIRTNGYTFNAINLFTGAFATVPNPLTGIEDIITAQKHYGCTFATGAKNLLVVRSGAGGYIDLANNGGFGSFGGFKTGCTPSLIPAEGMIASPEYTRTCQCSYQIQTSCAMTHEPDNDVWLSNQNLATQFKNNGGKIRSIGLNFGAPGDRFDDEKTLFLEYPYGETAAGFSAYSIPVSISLASAGTANYVRHIPKRISGSGNWIAASGIEANGTVTVNMVQGSAQPDPQPYTVTLYFAETEGKQAGERVFSVEVNGNSTGSIDIAAEAGQNRVVTKTLHGVTIGETMTISLSGQTGTPLLCGIKAVQENLVMGSAQ